MNKIIKLFIYDNYIIYKNSKLRPIEPIEKKCFYKSMKCISFEGQTFIN